MSTWLVTTELAYSLAGFTVRTEYIRANITNLTVRNKRTTSQSRIFNVFARINRCLFGKILEHILALFTIIKQGHDFSYICPVFCRKPSFLVKLYRIVINSIGSRYVTISLEHPLLDQHIDEPIKQVRYMQSVSNQFDIVIAIASSIKEYYIAYGRTKPIFLAPSIVDIDRFSTKHNAASGIRNLCYCGNLQHNEEIQLLLDSFIIAHKREPDLNLIIIGGGQTPKHTSTLITKYKKYIRKFDIVCNILFKGTITPSMIVSEYENIDLFLLPRPFKQYSEFGFPSKLGEYLSTGEPVVTTGTGDIPEYLFDNESAFLTFSEDPSDFAYKILEAIANPQHASEIGMKGRSVAEQHFSISAMTERITKFFKQ